MKKIIFTVLVFLAFASNLKAQSEYDFYDTCVTGQRLYFSILSDNSVAVVNGGQCDQDRLTGDMIIPSNVMYDGISYSVTSIGDIAFFACTGLTSLIIPNSVTSIEFGAFQHCSGLTSLTIPNSVISIGDYVFTSCTGLTSFVVESGNPVYDSRDNCNAIIRTADNTLIYGCQTTVIPNSVTSIGNGAFYECPGLTSLTIPNSVTFIGNSAFIGCSGLTTIIVETGNPVYDSRNNCNAIIRTADNTLIFSCQTTAIPNSVTSIGDYTFSGCSGLTSLTIPNSVTSIGDGAFQGCSGLTSLTIPNSVTSIGSSAFYGCTGLTSLTIPNSVTSIGNGAFRGCTGLTSLTIPNSVTSIGDYTFEGCSGLTSLTIPNSVTSIGYFAFYGCSDLTTIIFEGTTPPALAGCFSGTFPVSNDLTIYVPVGSQEDYEASFGPAASDINIIESNVGIENIDHTSAMAVYPNPTTGVVNVECTMNNGQAEAMEFQLFDAFGRLLQTTDVVGANNYSSLRTDPHGSSVQTTQINLSHYASGIYFIKAVADGKVMAVRKVIKN